MTDTDALTARLEKLEERIAFQDQAIDDLNETITGQWKQIDNLKREMDRLTDQVRELETDAESGRKEPPPPHY